MKSRRELRLRAASILGIRVLPSRRVDRSATQDAFLFSLLTEARSAGQERSYVILRISKNPRNRARSASSEKDRRCRRCDVTVRDWRKRLSRHGVYHHALERSAGSARSNTRGTRGTRKTLPHVLATDLWFRPATGGRAGRDEGSHSRFFCAAAGTPGSECGAQGAFTEQRVLTTATKL